MTTPLTKIEIYRDSAWVLLEGGIQNIKKDENFRVFDPDDNLVSFDDTFPIWIAREDPVKNDDGTWSINADPCEDVADQE